MKLIRRIHLFLGCFFAPLLLFYVSTGWYQSVTLRRNKGVGEADDWPGRLRSVHVDQIYPTEAANAYSPWLFRALVVTMAVALIVTIVLGVILAFRSIRQRWMVWLSLGLGFLVPVLFLWLGQRR
ncbi:MAG TPA: hypothetical protein VFT34_13875 [Verrucomicrobiae bacterium]|nr:hypothetical protein [Verrucomicrobiae bacterium]